MCRWSPWATLLALPLAAVLVSACTAPPNKEIGDAQEAVKAAAAAGAERYAPDEYQSAVESYKLANDAVMAGDYRLALDRALQSRDHALNATREAADLRERARDEVQRTMFEVATSLAAIGSLLDQAERARVPRRVLTQHREALAQINADVQKAGAAMRQEDFAAAEPLLISVRDRLEKSIAALKTAIDAQSAKQAR